MTLRAHIIVAICLLGVLAFILRLLRRGHFTGKYALLWITVGGAMVPLALWPGLVTTVAKLAGVYYEPAVLIFAILGFLLMVAMQFSYELSRLEERARTLAEEVALLRGEIQALNQSADAPAPGSPDGETPKPPTP